MELNAKSADLARSAWAGAGTRDFSDIDVPGLDGSGSARQLDWAARRVDLPAGRYETLLPPAAMADLMIYLYWSAGARDAMDGRSVFSKPGGGSRLGERLASPALTLRSDPAAPGLECAPFVIAHASGRDSSVFDNGLALAPTDWISAGQLAALTQTRLLGAAVRAGGDAGDRQPDHGRAGRHRVARRHDRPHRPRPAADLPVVHPRG